MRQMVKRMLTGLLAAAMLLTPALAAGEETPAQQLSPWAYDAVADCYAMGLMDDNYGAYILDPVTDEQLDQLTGVVGDKLALLGVPVRQAGEDGTPLVIDHTRGGVMNALYQEAAAYAFPGVEAGMEAFLQELGVVKGTGSDLALKRTCTYQEAMVMANRLILALYDANDAGSKGLLWKATNGRNTLYLLGTIHLDRDNVYPLHKSVRDALLSSENVAFELDFNDPAGLETFAALQMYGDGTTLADHISPELYQRVSQALLALGMTQEQIDLYKPWALANTFNTLASMDDTTSGNAMAVDLYLNSAASWAGLPVEGVETYELQGNIFDTLTAEYQEAYLDATLAIYEAEAEGSEPSQEAADAAEENQQVMSEMFAAWKTRDPEAFARVYDKAAIVSSDDELNARLFTDRDPGMIQAAADYLETEGEHTFFMAVGAGHMVDPGGIVSGLKELGYTVELVP
jgi:uncharacterized protein YbaP (TraB family)